MERKSVPCLGLKVIDEEQGIVEHIITVFGVIDYGKDVSHLGSFKKTIDERGTKVLVLDQHRTDSVNAVLGKPLSLREIGRDELPREVLDEFPEATGGVLARTKFLLDTNEGRGAFIRLKEDAVREWSYGYDALDTDFSKMEDKDGEEIRVRNLRTIKLYEYSPVLWGMNPATSTISAKEASMEEKPYDVFEEDGEYCVYKIDEDGNRTGDTLGCHSTVDEAEDQVRALYASEEDMDKDKDRGDEPVEDSKDNEPAEDDKDGEPVEDNKGNESAEDEGSESKDNDEEPTEEKSVFYLRKEDPESYVTSRKQSLFDLINKIAETFFEQFGYGDQEKDEYYWVADIHEEYAIIEAETSTELYYYKVSYTRENDIISFAPKSQWVKGQFKFVPDGADIMQRVEDDKDNPDTILSVMITIPEGREEKVLSVLKGTNVLNIFNQAPDDEHINAETIKRDYARHTAAIRSLQDDNEAGPSQSSPTSDDDDKDHDLQRDRLFVLQAIDAELNETENLLET